MKMVEAYEINLRIHFIIWLWYYHFLKLLLILFLMLVLLLFLMVVLLLLFITAARCIWKIIKWFHLFQLVFFIYLIIPKVNTWVLVSERSLIMLIEGGAQFEKHYLNLCDGGNSIYNRDGDETILSVMRKIKIYRCNHIY